MNSQNNKMTRRFTIIAAVILAVSLVSAFIFDLFPRIRKEAVVKGISEYKLDTSRIESWLSANKVITTPRAYLKTSVASGYEHAHYSSDLRVIHDIVRNDYPEFLNAFNDVFLGSNYFYDCNMFIMPWNEFDDYCKWLFGILLKKVNTSFGNPMIKFISLDS